MSQNRLHSYYFNCPCCTQPHARLFEYYAKFRGMIPENEPITPEMNATVMERVVMDEDRFVGRSTSLGDSVFRCGNCFEFFKFEDTVSDPVKLSKDEEEIAISKFKPIPLYKSDAIKFALDMFKKISTNDGYSINEETGEISIFDGNGREYCFKIADELVNGMLKNNPNFEIKERGLHQSSEKQQG